MNDDELLRGLRDAARRSDAKPPMAELSAPLGPQFEAPVAERIARKGRVVKPRRAALWFALAAPLAAAAAAIALWLAWPGRSPAAPLPEYAMEIAGGVDTERGATPSRTDVSARAGDTLSIVLRPATDVSAPVEAHLFVSQRDVPATLRVSPSGSVELRARVADLAPASETDVSATIVLTRPGLDPKGALAPGAAVPAGARVMPLRVHVVR
jgi:hypothetical protein